VNWHIYLNLKSFSLPLHKMAAIVQKNAVGGVLSSRKQITLLKSPQRSVGVRRRVAVQPKAILGGGGECAGS